MADKSMQETRLDLPDHIQDVFTNIYCFVVRCGEEMLQTFYKDTYAFNCWLNKYLDRDTLKDVTKDTYTHIVSDPGMLVGHIIYIYMYNLMLMLVLAFTNQGDRW